MKRIIIFLAVTFGLSWRLLVPAGFALETFQNGENSSALMMGLIALSMFFPLVGALAANRACKPQERIDLGWKPRSKQNVRIYVAAWLAPAVITLLGCVVFFAVNPQWFDPTMHSYIQAAASAGTPVDQLADQMPPTPVMVGAALVAALTVAPFINMIPAFGEELGWRGMLFPSMAEHMSARNAALASGAIWGLWHAPAIAMGHNYGMGYAGFPIAGILVMMLSCTAMACCLALLRQRSASVWPCALAHGAFNAIANVGVAFCTCGQTLFGPSPLGLIAGIPLFAVGVACWLCISPSRAEAAFRNQT